ncbi:ferredoxin [uncultured Shimia sp.]|uniref:ferredoxin n=1 Tax=uncultured Shimia sp. TaxID=573152 RepID=UPI0026183A32|nr:ferredoxin [uncultured Shimia sp.]
MYDQITTAAEARHLAVLGGFHPERKDIGLDGIGTILLLGPHEPGFWPHVTQTPEFLDYERHPIDRWSRRVLTDLAGQFGARTYFPFTGPPYHPFYQWALRTQRCHVSPINLLVHDTAGLFASFRGALGLADRIKLPPPPASPCITCTDQPCVTACPVDAFSGEFYDVDACRGAIGSDDPKACLSRGCAARRACPASQAYGRLETQSSFHMRIFLENGS